MSEREPDGGEPDVSKRNAAMEAGATEVVLGTPGVRRVEPSLRGALRRITGPVELATTALTGLGEGVHLLRRGRTVAVTAEVVLDGSRSVLAVAEEVQERLVAFVEAQGHVPGPVRVHVLDLDPADERHLHAVPDPGPS